MLLIGAVLVIRPEPSYAASSILKQSAKQIASKKYKAAIRTLTKAMNSGSLSDKDMALALYQRGQAYNGRKRHSAAIADLTGALFLGKLGAKEKQKAYGQRAIAYRATGYGRLAKRDAGRSGRSSSRAQISRNRGGRSMLPSAVPGFRTTVKTSPTRRPARKRAAQKTRAAKKVAIPAFRTSIAVDQ
ncbi:MAG: hypothetical protein L3J67_02780 [Hyphomicrobiaceae bacterium]|nr:hypothetical protein [Hyphomicrobiaceae bacterium]